MASVRMNLRPAILLGIHLGTASGHGMMLTPRPRNQGNDIGLDGCMGSGCMWFSQGCTIGCKNCSGTGAVSHFWGGSACDNGMDPTIVDSDLRTINPNAKANTRRDWTKSNPWRAPGYAPVFDPCGIASGTTKNNIAAGGFTPPGHKKGELGSKLRATTDSIVWRAGDKVEVEFGIMANHGGGYQYRLCKKSGEEPLTEECFQKTPLSLFNRSQAVRYLRTGERVIIDAKKVAVGTKPEGSEWVKNPIPPCKGLTSGADAICLGPLWKEPCKGCFGFHDVKQSVVDWLRIPDDLEAGDYVLGWRWDVEQTAQVWQSCADISIENGPSTDPLLI